MRSKEIETHKKELKLTKEQREVLIGLMLGSGRLETQNKGRTYRLKIEQCEAYVRHLYELFAAWAQTPPQSKVIENRRSVSRNWWFQTLSHASFRFYAHQFYQNEEKCVPRLIHRWLTPRAIAYWFMDDGLSKSPQSKGVLINTQSFTLREVQHLCQVLQENFDLKTKPQKQREGYQIYIPGESYATFRNLIEPYLIPEMHYKLPPARQTQLPKE